MSCESWCLVGLEGDPHSNGGPLSWFRYYGEVAVDQPHALLHAQQSQPFFSVGRYLLMDLKAVAIVFDFHADSVSELPNGDRDPFGAGVFGDVGQAFLSDAIDDGFPIAVQVLHDLTGVEPNLNAGPL